VEKRTSTQNRRAPSIIKTIESGVEKAQRGEDDTYEKEPRKLLKKSNELLEA